MSETNGAMVTLSHLGKYFGAEKAVNDVNLAVAQGEFVTLLGPSGCGKTTTLRCIAGLERPDMGEIRIGGDVVASAERGIYLTPEDRNIGMVFQSYAVWPHMTVFDNVAYGLRVRRASADVIKQRTTRALELVSLGHLADRFATKLSGGQRQRLAQARSRAARARASRGRAPSSTNRGWCCSTNRSQISTPSCASRCGSSSSGCSGKSASPRST